jgi:hypothetical protein
MSECCSICNKPSQFVCAKQCGATFCSEACASQAKSCSQKNIGGMFDDEAEMIEAMMKLRPFKLLEQFDMYEKYARVPKVQRQYVLKWSQDDWDYAFHFARFNKQFLDTFLSATLKSKVWTPTLKTDWMLNYVVGLDMLQVFMVLLPLAKLFETSTQSLLEEAALANSANILQYMIQTLNWDPSIENNNALVKAAEWDKYRSIQVLLQDERVIAAGTDRALKTAVGMNNVRAAKLLLAETQLTKEQLLRIARANQVDEAEVKNLIDQYFALQQSKRSKMGMKI